MEIRREFISLLRKLEFEAYICFSKNLIIDSVEKKLTNEVYDKLFTCLISDRLSNYKKYNIDILFEQHDNKINKREMELEDIVNKLMTNIEMRDQSLKRKITQVKSAGKNTECLAISDYILGVFGKYLTSIKSEKEPWEKRDFDDLSLKIRLIHDHDNKKFFFRNNPFDLSLYQKSSII